MPFPGAAQAAGWTFPAAATLTLHQDFVNNTTLADAAVVGPQASVARTGTATRHNSSGNIEDVSANTARFEHDTNGTQLGLQVEEPSENLALRSEALDNAAYSDVGTPTVTADNATSPRGTSTADTLESDGASDEGREQAITVADDSETYVVSWFLKEGTETHARIKLDLTGGTTTKSGTGDFNLNTGVAGTAGGDLDAIGIESEAQGFERCFARITNNGTGNTTLTAGVLVGDAAADTGTIEVFGLQIEKIQESGENTDQPTSYMPTEGSTVTRGEENVTITDMSWFDETTGTMFVHVIENVGNVVRVPRIFALSDGSERLRFEIANNSARVEDGDNDPRASVGGTPITYGTAFKCACAWSGDGSASDQLKAVIDGGTVASDTGALSQVSNVPDTLILGSGPNANWLNGIIKEVKGFSDFQSDADLQSLTS